MACETGLTAMKTIHVCALRLRTRRCYSLWPTALRLSSWITAENLITELTFFVDSVVQLAELQLDVPLPHLQILRVKVGMGQSDAVEKPHDILDTLTPSAAGLRIVFLHLRIMQNQIPVCKPHVLQMFESASRRGILCMSEEII
jgi:hypothetical protein